MGYTSQGYCPYDYQPGTPEWDQWLADSHIYAEREIRAMKRENRRTGFIEVVKLAWSSIIHMGMFSSDPEIARDAMVLTAQEQIGKQRQMHAAERLRDREDEERRARLMARAFFDEAEARHER